MKWYGLLVVGFALAVSALVAAVAWFPLAAPMAVAGLLVGGAGLRYAERGKAAYYGIVATCALALVISLAVWLLLIPHGVEEEVGPPVREGYSSGLSAEGMSG